MIEKKENIGLPLNFKPYQTENLIRLGHNRDGGYIITQEILDKSSNLLTFGLSDEFTFEEDFINLNKNSNIYVYDHTVTKTFWIKNFIFSLLHFFHNRSNFLRIFKYFNYKKLFKKKNVKHFKLRLRKDSQSIPDSVSLKEIIDKGDIVPEKTLLKIDIDMDEYRILDDIINFDFLALIIEFTHTDLHQDRILKFLDNAKNFKIIHIHGNNFDYPDENQNPVYLEITFGNIKYLNISNNLINYDLPIKNLDFQNDIKKKEIPIVFKKI